MKYFSLFNFVKDLLFDLRTLVPVHSDQICVSISFSVFLDTVYFPLNLQRLRDTHKIVTDKLTELEIPFLRRPAGLYIWADFSKVRFLKVNLFYTQQGIKVSHHHYILSDSI